MRYLFYYYDSCGTLILKYKDDFGKRITHRYIFYTLKEAIKLFREQFNLKHKKIQIKKLYGDDSDMIALTNTAKE